MDVASLRGKREYDRYGAWTLFVRLGGRPDACVAVSSASATAGAPGALVWVGGIQVSREIGDRLQRLLAAAEREGVHLEGSGYRSRAEQEQLRKDNGCADIQTAPASTCRPPTAIPGTSMHEKGLAIDFRCPGSGGKPFKASRCFSWLEAHAKAYGFRTLSDRSEPWHWSVNGR